MKNKVNVLGTDYTIEVHKVSEDDYLRENRCSGYCAEESKLIVIADMSESQYFTDMGEREQDIYRKKTLRHELIHAFLNESGLSDSSSVPGCGWAKNEEMIDWIAIQFPKMVKVFKEVGCLDEPEEIIKPEECDILIGTMIDGMGALKKAVKAAEDNLKNALGIVSPSGDRMK